jgi:hypothetical protein
MLKLVGTLIRAICSGGFCSGSKVGIFSKIPTFPKKWYFTSQTTLFLERSPIYKEKPGTVVEKPA